MLRDKATEGKRERKTKVGETERKKNVRQCGLWEIERENYRYKDREGAGKIDTMEEIIKKQNLLYGCFKKQSTQKISNQKMKLKERDKSILEYVQCLYNNVHSYKVPGF